MSFDMYRAWAESFLKRRAAEEGFEPSQHSFFVHSPLLDFVQTLLTGHVRNHYYMSREEIVTQSFMLHEHVLSRDPKFHLLALQFARHVSFKKDQVVIGLIVRTARNFLGDEEIELLADFTPDVVLHRWYETLVRGNVHCRLAGRRSGRY